MRWALALARATMFLIVLILDDLLEVFTPQQIQGMLDQGARSAIQATERFGAKVAESGSGWRVL